MKNDIPEASYAQYNEDTILYALLSDVDKGFYVDIGANYETDDSVTKLFYIRGWSGINIEPITSLANILKRKRKRDTTLNVGVASKNARKVFREYKKTHGHSTFSGDQMEYEHLDEAYVDHEIRVETLKKIFDENNVGTIHFLKIDVEGFEYEVVAGADWKQYRPWVICIEANHKGRDWRSILLSSDYKLFIQDGLNEYYIASEQWGLTKDFAEKSVYIQQYIMKSHQVKDKLDNEDKINKLSTRVAEQEAENLQMRNLYSKVDQLSMYNHSLRQRIKIAIVGLTSDWIKYKFDHRR